MMTLLSVLVNSLWEGAVIAFAAWLVLRIARNANATTRYLVWTCALAATVVLPVATAFTVSASRAPAAAYVSAPDTASISVEKPVRIKTHVAFQARETQAPRRFEVRIPQNIVWAALAVWGAVTLWQLVRFVFALGALEKLKRNATPLPIDYRQQLERWNTTDRAHAQVRLCVSDETLVPIAVGLFDAMILVPTPLLERLAPDDVDRILLHEFAHLRRRDDWIHAFQRIVSAVLFFNPAVAFIAHQMDLEREVSCDDLVLERDGLQPVPYATCLTKMAEIVAWPYAPLAAPGVFNTRRNLSIRVERLLTSARDNRTRIAAVPALAALAVIAGAGVAGAAVSPAFSFAIPTFEHKANVAMNSPAQTHAKVRATTKTVTHTQVAQVQAIATAVTTAFASPKPVAVATTKPAPAPKPKATARPKTATPSPVTRSSPSADGDYIQQLESVGYGGLPLEELIQLKGVGVNADYIRQIENAGFAHPSTRDLIQLRATGVTPDYIAQIRQRFGNLSVRDIGEMRAVGVTPEYVNELTNAGYSNLSARELIQLRATGVTPEYIAQMRSRFGSLSIRDLGEMRAVGVTPDYVNELANAGYSNLSARDLIQFRALGIDGDYIRKAADHGFKNLSARKLIELKATGIL